MKKLDTEAVLNVRTLIITIHTLVPKLIGMRLWPSSTQITTRLAKEKLIRTKMTHGGNFGNEVIIFT